MHDEPYSRKENPVIQFVPSGKIRFDAKRRILRNDAGNPSRTGFRANAKTQAVLNA
jgi:hypothetical protein